MGAAESIGQLDKATKALLARWQIVREQWQDPVADSFAEDYLYPLERDVKWAMAAMAQAGKVVVGVRRDCD